MCHPGEIFLNRIWPVITTVAIMVLKHLSYQRANFILLWKVSNTPVGYCCRVDDMLAFRAGWKNPELPAQEFEATSNRKVSRSIIPKVATLRAQILQGSL